MPTICSRVDRLLDLLTFVVQLLAVVAARSHRKSPENPMCSQVSGVVCATRASSTSRRSLSPGCVMMARTVATYVTGSSLP